MDGWRFGKGYQLLYEFFISTLIMAMGRSLDYFVGVDLNACCLKEWSLPGVRWAEKRTQTLPPYKAINCLTKITNEYRRIEPVPVCLLGVAKRMEDGLPCPKVEALDRQSDLRMWLQAGSPPGPWA